MNNELKIKMKKVLWNILEQHAFLMLDEHSEKIAINISEPYLEFRMSFICNDYVGYFKFIIPESVSKEIELNLVGSEVTYDDFDGGKEMLNIIGANVLTELYGSSSRVNLSLPSFQNINASILDLESQNDDAVILELNGLSVILRLILE